jgi:putative ABC transport system permease protein
MRRLFTARSPGLPTRSSRLRSKDLFGVATIGMRGRPTRTALSAASVAIGVATMVSVLGISSSSRAQLVAAIDSLGTNLLTVAPGQSFSGGNVTLPRQAPAMIGRIGPVLAVSAISEVGQSVNVYRNDRISSANTNGIAVYAAQTTLIATLEGSLQGGRFLNDATSRLPAVVLGAAAASALGIDRADGPISVWISGRWFSVVGILRPLELAPELDLSVLVGYPIAQKVLGSDGRPVEIYVRAYPASIGPVESVLAATADPPAPQDVSITNPSDALIARADASSAFQSLFLALGAVAVVVGGIGITNVMVMAVLERRGEIGLRRALGAKRIHIAAQFVCESALLAGIGGVAGSVCGGFATAVFAHARHWQSVVPVTALFAAVAGAVVVGVVAGIYPARRASRLSPSTALRSV